MSNEEWTLNPVGGAITSNYVGGPSFPRCLLYVDSMPMPCSAFSAHVAAVSGCTGTFFPTALSTGTRRNVLQFSRVLQSYSLTDQAKRKDGVGKGSSLKRLTTLSRDVECLGLKPERSIPCRIVIEVLPC